MNSKLAMDKTAFVVTALDEAGGEKSYLAFPDPVRTAARLWKRSVRFNMDTIDLPPDFKDS